MLSIESTNEALATADDLPQRLEMALGEPQRSPSPGPSPERGGERIWTRMSPEMSYGRHAGPAPHTARSAAVALLLFRRAGHWHLPLTERAVTLGRHAGQISLPGGVIDAGETAIDAARRELYEELGFDCPHLIVGRLADCYVFASDFLVTPWIIASYDETIEWRPHDREVQRVIELPLAALLDEGSYGQTQIERGPLVFEAPCIRIGDTCVWGATAVILGELADTFSELVPAER